MAAKVYILSILILYGGLSREQEQPSNTFVGSNYKKILFALGEELYYKLMKACYVENKESEKIAS